MFVGPSKHDPISSDPYVMSLRLNQKQFMMGSLYLRPLKTKPEQIVNKGTMVITSRPFYFIKIISKKLGFFGNLWFSLKNVVYKKNIESIFTA